MEFLLLQKVIEKLWNFDSVWDLSHRAYIHSHINSLSYPHICRNINTLFKYYLKLLGQETLNPSRKSELLSWYKNVDFLDFGQL